jgi:hypothetical protein
VTIKTVDELFAGTDNDIFIKLYGNTGDVSEEFCLNDLIRGNDFERGNTDVVTFDVGKDLGDIVKIDLRFDDRRNDDWGLEWVKVRRDENGAPESYFPCSEWFANTKVLTVEAKQ